MILISRHRAPSTADETAREADLTYALCVTREGHRAVHVEPADRETGQPGYAVCEDCGTDLTDYHRLNPGG
jgi:hypothetical protein